MQLFSHAEPNDDANISPYLHYPRLPRLRHPLLPVALLDLDRLFQARREDSRVYRLVLFRDWTRVLHLDPSFGSLAHLGWALVGAVRALRAVQAVQAVQAVPHAVPASQFLADLPVHCARRILLPLAQLSPLPLVFDLGLCPLPQVEAPTVYSTRDVSNQAISSEKAYQYRLRFCLEKVSRR